MTLTRTNGLWAMVVGIWMGLSSSQVRQLVQKWGEEENSTHNHVCVCKTR